MRRAFFFFNLWVYVYVFVCVYMFICMCMCVCMCVCVYVEYCSQLLVPTRNFVLYPRNILSWGGETDLLLKCLP